MKTIKQWFNELPEPQKTEALENTPKLIKENIADDLEDAIYSAFRWDRTKQGYDYWQKICDSVAN